MAVLVVPPRGAQAPAPAAATASAAIDSAAPPHDKDTAAPAPVPTPAPVRNSLAKHLLLQAQAHRLPVQCQTARSLVTLLRQILIDFTMHLARFLHADLTGDLDHRATRAAA